MKLTTKKLKQLIREELNSVLVKEYEKPDPIKNLYNALQKATQEDSLARINYDLDSISRNAKYALKDAGNFEKTRIAAEAKSVMAHVDRLVSAEDTQNNQQVASMIKGLMGQVMKAAS